jgi:hypothetical protein
VDSFGKRARRKAVMPPGGFAVRPISVTVPAIRSDKDTRFGVSLLEEDVASSLSRS